MIIDWFSFNENKDYKSEFIKRVNEIRNVFLDLEDMGVVRYSVALRSNERSIGYSFNPRGGDFNKWAEFSAPILSNNYNKSTKVCILVDIKIPSEQNEFGSSVINFDGLKLFDDIIPATLRLNDMGYDVKLDLNSNHGSYKPLKILVYYNL